MITWPQNIQHHLFTSHIMKLLPAIPVFRIFSVEKAKEFYLDYLGFSLDWEHQYEDNFPLYLQVSRSGLIIHLSEHHGDSTPGSTAFIPEKRLMPFMPNSRKELPLCQAGSRHRRLGAGDADRRPVR